MIVQEDRPFQKQRVGHERSIVADDDVGGTQPFGRQKRIIAESRPVAFDFADQFKPDVATPDGCTKLLGCINRTTLSRDRVDEAARSWSFQRLQQRLGTQVLMTTTVLRSAQIKLAREMGLLGFQIHDHVA